MSSDTTQKIERWAIIITLLVQLSYAIYHGGEISQKVQDLADRVARLEDKIDRWKR